MRIASLLRVTDGKNRSSSSAVWHLLPQEYSVVHAHSLIKVRKARRELTNSAVNSHFGAPETALLGPGHP